MMEIKEIIENLEKTKEFKDYKKENEFSFLTHIFHMDDPANKDDFQVGYYNKDDTITTFIISKDQVKVMPEAEIFKKPDAKIKKLDLDEVKISIEQSDKISKDILEKKYKQETPSKRILILQNIEEGLIYNITFITQTSSMINIKIDAKTGEVIHESITPLSSLMAK